MRRMPTWCCNSIFDIDLDVLTENNIKYVFTDLDNTLAPYYIATPEEKVINFINELKDKGFKVIIVSNNTGKRVETFAENLNIPYISGAKKPFTSTLKNYIIKNNINLDECVIVGDQMVTDIGCATKLNCRCILTSPLDKKEPMVTYLNRKIDQHLRKKYNIVEECKKIDRRS